MNKKLLLLTATLLMSISSIDAKVKLAAIFADNMVLQQQAKSNIWGTATPNTNVMVTTSWDGVIYKGKSDKQGRFLISINTPEAGGPHQIEISDGDKLVLSNILIGDVWFCSGQSNMEMPVKGFRGQPVQGSHRYIVDADEKQAIRLFTVERAWSKTPKEDVAGTWYKHNSKSVSDFSAAAYFFGNILQRKLDIPIGLIHCSWSASKIEAWMSKETLAQIPEVDMSVLANDDFEYPNGTPTLLDNAMVQPLEGLAIKGIIWYQGEANSNEPALYKKLFPALALQWRNFFKSHQLPIYYTQIAPWQSGNKDELNWAYFRQAQLELMNEVPDVGMAITVDAGSEKFIHPPHKIKVGERLAYWALAKTYGLEGFAYSGPIYKGYELKDSVVEVSFDYSEDGLNPENRPLEGFEIAGKDGVFVPAKAEIINSTNRVKIWSDEVKEPNEIRYCFRNYMLGNLTNNADLPAAPFRMELQE